jgi:plastocyanin
MSTTIHAPDARRARPLLHLAAALLLVAGACGGEGGFGTSTAGPDTAADLSYVIPAGAGAALDAGEPLEVLPPRLEVSVGDVIEIENEDDRGHLVGPFFVGAGETLRQRFASPGEFVGECTVHPSGQIVVEVR